MYELTVWWAGHQLERRSIKPTQVEEEVEKLQQRLSAGSISLNSCGISMVVNGLCFDVLKDGTLVRMYNLKK